MPGPHDGNIGNEPIYDDECECGGIIQGGYCLSCDKDYTCDASDLEPTDEEMDKLRDRADAIRGVAL